MLWTTPVFDASVKRLYCQWSLVLFRIRLSITKQPRNPTLGDHHTLMSSGGKPVGSRASGADLQCSPPSLCVPSEGDGTAHLEVYSAALGEKYFGDQQAQPALHTPVPLPLPTKVVTSNNFTVLYHAGSKTTAKTLGPCRGVS